MSADWKDVYGRLVFGALICLLAGATGAADVMSAAEVEARVKVRFVKPEQFATTHYDHESLKGREAILAELGKYVQKAAAPRLAAGQTLQIDVLDLKRAGSSGRAGGPRIVRDTDPPRIDLGFRVLDASGAVVRMEKKRQLRDMQFMTHRDPSDSDPLRYEKRLLDDWVDRDFPPPKQ